MQVTVRDYSTIIKKFERACKRSNCTYSLLRTEIVKDPDNPGEVKVYNIYDVSEPERDPDHEGFKVLKRFDHVENITKTVVGEDTESNNEYLQKCKCDDCGKNIKSRRFSYLLERLIDGTKMQVGSSCLKKYANKKMVDSFFDLPSTFDSDFDDNNERDCIPSSYDVDIALAVVIKEFRNYTYYNDFKYEFTVDAFSFACARYEKDDKAEALAKKLKDYILNMDATNEWARNLAQIMRNGYFSKTNYGYVRSAVTLLRNRDFLETYCSTASEEEETVPVKKASDAAQKGFDLFWEMVES
mgnify:CR=1 FL=1